MSEQRKWQRQAFDIWTNGIDGVIQPNFTAVVTPGGGKTRFAGDCAKYALDQGIVHQIMAIVPSRSIRRGFAKSLAEHQGIVLDRLTNRGLMIVAQHAGARNPFGRDVNERLIQGCVATYQQVANHPQLFKKLMRTPTLIILDEIHHNGIQKSWGDGLRVAFEDAKHRLLLSGTPWRTDQDQMPFASYVIEQNDRGIPAFRVGAEFSYMYADALSDGIVRPVAFPTLDGECEWFSKSGVEMTHNLKEEINPKFFSERLTTWLKSDESMREMVRTANERLVFLRTEGGHPDAGGLIVANDQSHAKQLAVIVREVTRTDPAIAISEDSDLALRNIEHFQKSSRPWLIAVRMVSEGTDIPRLRVLLYATLIKTELFFKQSCGRVVRMIAGAKFDQQAYVYIPADVELIRFAEQFREDVAAWAALHKNKELETAAAGAVTAPSIFTPISATTIEDVVLEDGLSFEPPWLAVIRDEIRKLNLTTEISEIQVAKLHENVRRRERGQAYQESWLPDERQRREVRLRDGDTPDDQRDKLRRSITNLVGTCARRFNIGHDQIRRDLLSRFGPIEFLSLQDLRKQADLLQLWLIGGEYGGNA